jgi:hypothetical protein
MGRFLAVGLLCFLAAERAPVRAQAGAGKGEEPPTLYEMTAHSDLVVAAIVTSGQIKLAKIKVDEVFRGAVAPGDELQIAFRDFNLDLGKADRIVFTDGEALILFLIPEVNLEGERKGPDRYTLYRGRFGKFNLPREGAGIYLEAVKEFSRLAAEKDHRKLYELLKGLLGDPNPILAQAGMREILRLDLMEISLLPRVLPYLRDPSPVRRIAALRLIGSLFSDLKPEQRDSDLKEEGLGPVQEMARNDTDETVREAAVETLGKWGGLDVRPTLDAVAELDAAQSVRYKAKVIILKEGKLAPAAPKQASPGQPKSGPP